jgi:probable F420-dependent oxidoreductase
VARRAEALGYRALWVFQRLLYPRAPRNEYYGAPGGQWPEAFRSTLDPLAILAFASAVTERVRLGVSVLVLPFYSPVVLAKELATIDVLSRGRLDVGLGLGWSEDEMTAVGSSMAGRGPRADEFLRCLKALWTDDEETFAGAFYQVPATRFEPKPVQRPHPPILLGGYHPAVLRRAAQLADGYTVGNIPLADVPGVVGRVQSAAAEAGRDPKRFAIVARGSYHVTTLPRAATTATTVGNDCGDSRGHRPVRGGRSHPALPRTQLPAGRCCAGPGARGPGNPRPVTAAGYLGRTTTVACMLGACRVHTSE